MMANKHNYYTVEKCCVSRKWAPLCLPYHGTALFFEFLLTLPYAIIMVHRAVLTSSKFPFRIPTWILSISKFSFLHSGFIALQNLYITKLTLQAAGR